MKTVMSRNLGSTGIRKQCGDNMELTILGSVGIDDSKMTLYRTTSGQEVIETNGDPCWDTEDGFGEIREQIMGNE